MIDLVLSVALIVAGVLSIRCLPWADAELSATTRAFFRVGGAVRVRMLRRSGNADSELQTTGGVAGAQPLPQKKIHRWVEADPA